MNLYTYTPDDPLNLTDPMGLFKEGDLYAVTPATVGFMAILTTNINVFGQRLAGSWGTGYSHVATEIHPLADGTRMVVESEPSGVQETSMSVFMARNDGRGSDVDRFTPNTPTTDVQDLNLTDFQEAHVGTPYNFLIFFQGPGGATTCSQLCDLAAATAGMKPINNKSYYGLAPLPSDLSTSKNYHLTDMDWGRK